MAHCCSKFTLTILSCLSVGLIAAACSCLIWAIVQFNLKDFLDNSPLLGIAIGALCVSVFVFIFSIIASCSNSGCLGFSLGIIFLALAAGLCAVFVFLIIKKEALIDQVGNVWVTATNINESIHHVEDYLKCQTWNGTVTILENGTRIYDPEGLAICKTKFVDAVDKYQVYILIGLGVGTVLLLIGVVLSFMKMCQRNEDEDDALIKRTNELEKPLSYGW